jgi:hypothetical protein
VSVLFWLCVVAIAALGTENVRLRRKIKVLNIRDADRLLEVDQINQLLMYGKEKTSTEKEGSEAEEERRSDDAGGQPAD